jgi:hypothetical protein
MPSRLFEIQQAHLRDPLARNDQRVKRVAPSSVIAREGGRSSIPETLLAERSGRGVLDAPLSRGMTTSPGTARLNQIGLPAYGIEAVRPPSTGMAWPLT